MALDLLRETGPMAVSSANLTGSPAATTAAQARDQLGDSVAVYLDGGPSAGGVASTIVDLTGDAAPAAAPRRDLDRQAARDRAVGAGADAGQQ